MVERCFGLTDKVWSLHLFVCFSGVGDFSIWEFSGNPVYFCCYDYFAANDPTAIHIVLFSLEEPYEIQLNQVTFWLSFLKSLVPVEDPIGMFFCLLMFLCFSATLYIPCVECRYVSSSSCIQTNYTGFLREREFYLWNKSEELYTPLSPTGKGHDVQCILLWHWDLHL